MLWRLLIVWTELNWATEAFGAKSYWQNFLKVLILTCPVCVGMSVNSALCSISDFGIFVSSTASGLRGSKGPDVQDLESSLGDIIRTQVSRVNEDMFTKKWNIISTQTNSSQLKSKRRAICRSDPAAVSIQPDVDVMSCVGISSIFRTAFHLFGRQVPVPAIQVPFRGFKDKDSLKLRCSDCYYKKIDERWWVLCKTHGRHKQRQHVVNHKVAWIVTHETSGHRPFQKKEETYLCNNCPPGPYDYKRKIFYKPEEKLKRKLRIGLHQKFFIEPYAYEKFM